MKGRYRVRPLQLDAQIESVPTTEGKFVGIYEKACQVKYEFCSLKIMSAFNEQLFLPGIYSLRYIGTLSLSDSGSPNHGEGLLKRPCLQRG